MVEARFEINAPKVIGETIDGETVIIDLESGCYYSLDQTGTLIWEQLLCHNPETEIAASLAGLYDGEPGDIARSLHEFIGKLLQEDLIRPVQGRARQEERKNPAKPLINENQRFMPPVLQKFTDMQELLLLDPIHEVEDGGWPHKKG